ncbi:hypothetical protein H7I53_19840 [Mycolicibacterium pulveris]|uniref:Uncharacterized protein n=1 Tax=Mycolicibacterium pulveris TaxID=36813 RepID=A0A7I7UR65_MYCPV|nr:hypothetical protein [Mycolicibacterium pulveris]MCV6982465.1 hypothetical protein [Mycolicibacterium pulveris]BBY83878.1 hypothetical protein MPUL_50360 [Mycolicibacterium pulveris]
MNAHHPAKRAARWALGAVAAAAVAGVVQFASTATAAADEDNADPRSASSSSASGGFDMTPTDPGSATFTPSERPAGGLTGGHGDRGDLVGIPDGPVNVGPAPVAETPPDVVVRLDEPPSPVLAPNVGDWYDALDDGLRRGR